MNISLEKIGKRYNQEWTFKNFNYKFSANNSYAIIGSNGSGKSTLLKIISGYLSPSSGKRSFTTIKGDTIDPTKLYQYISFCAPYIDIVEELTLNEFFQFHFNIKPIKDDFTVSKVISTLHLEDQSNVQLKYFSSGMKQKVKLASVLYAKQDLLLLDEPTTNLDTKNISWYEDTLQSIKKGCIVVIGSNQEAEYSFCDHVINIEDYKKS